MITSLDTAGVMALDFISQLLSDLGCLPIPLVFVMSTESYISRRNPSYFLLSRLVVSI